ncbi:MAG: L,D-transpeptidase family protein [Chthoniobacterales bacterium]
MRSFTAVVCLLISLCLVAATADGKPVGALRPGEFFWEPELSPSGPLVIIISLPDQTLSAYRNGIRVAYSSISSGTRGRSTPAGVFTILEKEVMHFSNKYHHAPMPHMQRLSWQGVAMHGGDLPGYPASHGCIRLPREFAKKLYSLTTRGTTVIVTDEKGPAPEFATNPGILLSAPDETNRATTDAEYEWNPERSPDGPITILASGGDKTIYVYRNAVRIARAPLELLNGNKSLGSHAFTMLEGIGDVPSALVPERPAHRWMALRTEGNVTLHDLARRLRISQEFAEKLYELVVPGTTVVVTDAPALRGSRSTRAIFLMQSAKK